MILFAYVALVAAPLLAVAGFLLFGATLETIAYSVVFEWLFLPLLGIKFTKGIPILDKATVAAITLIAGVLLYRQSKPLSRPSWIDLPMLVWCLIPIVSSHDNGLGWYDGLSAALRQVVTWGVPYLAGRILSRDTSFLIAMGKALLIGAVIYAPLCLIESHFSPQLHGWIYGVGGRANWEQIDFFGPLRWKPTVFLQTQLELTLLMGIGFLFGLWLWRAGKLQSIAGYAMSALVPIAAIATILGKSLGGFSLTLAGAGVLLLTRRFRSIMFLVALSLIGPLYITTRSLGLWSGQQAVDFLKEDISERRADSFGFRLHNEDILVERALERPIWGWGGWGRSLVYDENGKDISTTDGMWVIALGTTGIVGLSALYMGLLLPVWVVCLRRDRQLLWDDPRGAIVLVAAVVVVLNSIDCVANAMPNPIYPLLAGSLASIAMQPVASAAGRQVRLSLGMCRPTALSSGHPQRE